MMLLTLLFSSIVLIGMVTCFFLGTQGMFIQRTFLNIPLALFEANVERIGEKDKIEEGEILQYIEPRIIQGNEEVEDEVSQRLFKFKKENLEEDLLNYLKANLEHKVDSYKYAIKYYIYENDEFVEDTIDEANAIKIRFRCEYYKNYAIDQNLSFYIQEAWSVSYE